jgi:SAM-dependent methyltransferase
LVHLKKASKMTWSSVKFLFFVLVFSSVAAVGYASDGEEGEEAFKRCVIENKVLPKGSYTEKDAIINLDIAWQHQKAIRALAQEHADMFPKSLPDGEIPTLNQNGFHWGMGSAIPVELSKLIHETNPTTLLEIGSCYGCDAVALVKNYPLLSVSAVDICDKHVALMEALVAKCLDEEQRTRIAVQQADIMILGSIQQKENSIDIAVISKVLHFYQDADSMKALQNLFPLIKPGGYVIMSHMSNRAHIILEWLTWAVGGFVPQPGSLARTVTRCEKLQWGYYFSPEDMARIVAPTGFKIVTNQYMGMIYAKRASNYWMVGGVNMQEAVLYTVLRKPLYDSSQVVNINDSFLKYVASARMEYDSVSARE